MQDYPYGSQMWKVSHNIVIAVRLFDMRSKINWWLSEYDPISKIAFWYVTGFVEDEWGTISLAELESLEFVVEFSDSEGFLMESRIIVDDNFQATRFPDLPFHKAHTD